MIKERPNKFIDTVFECVDTGVAQGVFQILFEDEKMDGRIITVDGKKAISFGSCSYMGLEVDQRLARAAKNAIDKYGVHYSSSRAYSACPLYEEAEQLLTKIFHGHHAVIGGSTTLTHIGVMPVLLQDKDLIILDQKVHGSIQMSVQQLKARGARIEMIRHNNMEMLEDMIRENPNKYDQIWYMADGVYSMFGNLAPMDDLLTLLDKYENFHLYIDDAHGMSWTGKYGRGTVMGDDGMHPRIFLTTSLGKGFGVGGGIYVTSSEVMKTRILTCGSSYTFSGPVEPGTLGAIVESAKIHLSDEFALMQKRLQDKIAYTSKLSKELDLPEVYPSESPLFYFGLGQPKVGYEMINRLLADGFYTNIGIFPTVPVNCTGLRIPITLRQRDEDIKNVLEAFAYHLPLIFNEQKVKLKVLERSFKHDFSSTHQRYFEENEEVTEDELKECCVQHTTDINAIDKDLWNNLLGDNGSFDWEGCRFIQDAFNNEKDQESHWKLHYVIIKDKQEKPVLATFFSVMFSKDDMVAPEAVSMEIEKKRESDKYYLTSKVVSMGSLITEGQHLYLDRTNNLWQKALRELVKIMDDVKHQEGASALQLRDFDTSDIELREFLLNEGFFRADLPDAHVVYNPGWENAEQYIESLSKKSRYHVRKNMSKQEHLFGVEIKKVDKSENFSEIYQLYSNVKKNSFKINTFDLPERFFRLAFEHSSWELIKLKIRETNQLCSFVLCYQSEQGNYSPMVIGIDYSLNAQYNVYRQSLYQIMKQAIANQVDKVFLGMDASIEKQKLGAQVNQKSIYLQLDDNFALERTSIIEQRKNT